MPAQRYVWLTGSSVLVGAVLAIGYSRGIYSLPLWREPLSQSALVMVESVDLGTLAAGDSKVFDIVIHNPTGRTIALKPPQTSCGCIAISKKPILIDARSKMLAEFSYKAGATPGPISEKIIFFSASRNNVVWPVRVTGNVTADIWSEPASVSLPVGLDEHPSAKIVIHHVAGMRIRDIIVDAEELSVHTSPASCNELETFVTVSLGDVRESGKGNISVLGPRQSLLLTIPIRWIKRPLLKFQPSILRIAKDELPSSGYVERKILVYRGTKVKGRFVEVDTMVPWMRIAEMEDNGTVIVLRVRFDVLSLPKHFSDSVLTLTTDDRATPIQYAAMIR